MVYQQINNINDFYGILLPFVFLFSLFIAFIGLIIYSCIVQRRQSKEEEFLYSSSEDSFL
uniref:Uncharacterized protein n=1 Tax=Meloidogyne enterolobii TaxID=390850 RepID=A0A6V7VXQ0_MELEN|nr:unnamed protein product [Meloidogyne enterolobii]